MPEPSGAADLASSPSFPPAPARRSLIVFAAGLVITALGLSVARADFDFQPLTFDFLSGFGEYVTHPQTVLFGGLMALCGGCLCAFASRRAFPPDAADVEREVTRPKIIFDWYAAAALVLAAFALAILGWRLLSQQDSPEDVVVFLGALALVGYAVNAGLRFAPPGPSVLTARDALVAILLVVFTALINQFGLTHWMFAWIGDEGAFFEMARGIAEGKTDWNFFDLKGVYGDHPMLDSIYQAFVIKLIGRDIYGWRFAEVLTLAGSAALIYLLASLLLNRAAGLAAAVMLAANFYLMTGVRTGYNNLHAVFAELLVMLMLALAWKTGRTIYYFALGAAMGLCLYTFMASLLIWPVVAVLLLIDFFRRPNWGHVVIAAVMIAAFLLAVAPGILHSSFAHVVEVALHNSRREIAAANPGLVARTSIVQSFLVFWVNNQWRGIHVGSQLLDPLTGTLALAGLPIALWGIRRRVERLIVVWFCVVLLLQAGTNYVPGPSFTRMYILVPPVVLLAALTLTRLLTLLRPALTRVSARYIPALVLVPLLIAVPILNVHQLLVINPADIVHNSFVMLMKTLQEHPASKIVEIGSEPQVDQNLLLMLGWYPALKNNYRYVNVNGLGAEAPAAPTIYFISDQNEKLLDAVGAKLPPGYQRVIDRGPFGKDKAWLMMKTE